MQIANHVTFFIGLIISLISYCPESFGQSFEGEITFTKANLTDTVYHTYKIKDNKIRFDELDSKRQPVNHIIADLSKNLVYSLNPKRKLFVEMSLRPKRNLVDTSNFVVYKTENYKHIKGYKCYQWRVRNKKENTEIAFWVSDKFFDYFADFLIFTNNDEKCGDYYLQIPESKGYFPLLTVDRSLLREWRMCYEVESIKNMKLSASDFEIPKDYKLFSKN